MIAAFLMAMAIHAPALAQDTEMPVRPPEEYDYIGLNADDFFDDVNAPEPDPEYTIRPNVPYTKVRHPNGTATVRFTGRVRVTVRPPRMVVPIPGYNRTPRTSFVDDWVITGPDSNNNSIPDDLEMDWVDISVAPVEG